MADETHDAPVDETDAPVDGSTPAPVDATDGSEAPDAEAPDEAVADVIAEAEVDPDEEEPPAKPVSEAKKKADAVIAQRQVTRRTVTSKRVTPKAGAKVDPTAPVATSKARNAKVTETINARYTPPTPTYAKGPSPWWVPAIMFGLLIVGALIIMTNYMGLFGDAENIRLVIGLAFILGGIVTATQYR